MLCQRKTFSVSLQCPTCSLPAVIAIKLLNSVVDCVRLGARRRHQRFNVIRRIVSARQSAASFSAVLACNITAQFALMPHVADCSARPDSVVAIRREMPKRHAVTANLQDRRESKLKTAWSKFEYD
ncbi:hypothetical protein ACVXHB_08865 [Escherichia coli]